MDICKVHAELL